MPQWGSLEESDYVQSYVEDDYPRATYFSDGMKPHRIYRILLGIRMDTMQTDRWMDGI